LRVIGLDIGGANLKASDGERHSLSRAFALWQHPEQLEPQLRSLLQDLPPAQHLAVTMTGELADCFASKAQGVERILAAVCSVVDLPVHVWQTSGEFVPPETAVEFPRLTAAANWHALATWAGRMTPHGTGLLIDMGSTTTDIIPLVDGLPLTTGSTDLERLAAGELVYTGFRRTPVCAMARSVVLEGRTIPLAAEFFATLQDVHLICGSARENPSGCDTADGRPATIDCARSRLARMLCCDRSELSDEQLLDIARQIYAAQIETLTPVVSKIVAGLPQAPQSVLLCGEGESMLREVLDLIPQLSGCQRVNLNEALGPEHSQAACAFALARLGSERIR
jgi:(4-(4-[2-(gamma-L-glutamylamino)ethyl]phenoxymethyl)furan-2-yl)methanamine synthase